MNDVHLPRGAVALYIQPYGSPSQELAGALHPPWPRWMRRLYDVERHAGGADPDEGEVSLSAAVTALATRMKHRLDLIAWCASALEEIGWELAVDGDVIVAAKVTLPELARQELEDHGIYGPLTNVCELDDRGFPRIVERWETV
jgi:hypothetical protein